MTMKATTRRSPLALAILALLYEAPMHPYRMQQLLKERGKDEVVNVKQRASLYQTIDRLLRDKLIAVQETVRSENRPERTVYALTDAGRETLIDWMRAMLASPAQEFPEFPAALAHLTLLTPDDVRVQLERRAAALEAEVSRISGGIAQAGAFLPRLFLVESEYLLAQRQAELTWIRATIADLQAGRLTWSEELLRAWAEEIVIPPQFAVRDDDEEVPLP